MTDPNRQAKDRATELMAKGKLSASLEQWLRIVKAAPADLGARQKVGDLLARLGKKSEAIAAYLDVSKRYAEGGQFFKAIALCKVILTLDAEHKAAHQYLADLYSKARAPSAPAAPAAKPAPMAPLELQGLDTRAGRWIDDSDFVESVEAVEEVEPELLLEVEVEAPAPPLMGAPAALPVIPLFSQLSRDEFIAVLKAGMEVRSFSPGLEIVKEGDVGNGMFAIVQGQVAVLHEGKKVAQMGEGDFFGEMALMSNSRRLATVTAESHVVVLEFPRTAMDQVFQGHPGVAAALDAFYRERLLANLLRCSPLLEPLSSDQKVELSGRFEVKTFEMGHVIMVQGQPGDGLYLIIRGRCGVMDRSGKRYPALQEGDAFGEISAATGHAATANVRAESQVVTLKLPLDVFRAIVLPHPKVRELLKGLIDERIARTRSMDLRI